MGEWKFMALKQLRFSKWKMHQWEEGVLGKLTRQNSCKRQAMVIRYQLVVVEA